MKPLERDGTKVEHDVLITGKSALEHEIDVLITIDAGPVLSRTLIQSKDWGSPVKKEHVMSLHAIMNDVPGNVGGFFVTRFGYQSGARIYARQHGIKLYILREARDADWKGHLKIIGLTIGVNYGVCRSITPNLDMDWIRQRMFAAGVPRGTTFDFHAEPSDGVFESGRTYEFEKLVMPHLPPPGETRMVHLDFADDALLLNVEDLPVPTLRCLGFELELITSTYSQSADIRLDEYVKYHFHDVLEDEAHFLAADGGPPTQRS